MAARSAKTAGLRPWFMTGFLILLYVLPLGALSPGATNPFPGNLDPPFDPVVESKAGHFVRNDRGRLMLDGREFRFVSVNIPNYHMVEDPAGPGEPTWHRVDAFEQLDACRAVRRLGGQVFRIYVPSVEGGLHPTEGLAHVYLGPEGKITYNEELFRDLDRGLAIAASQGLRVIIPLVDNWNWFGGCDDWAALAGSSDFWDDEQTWQVFRSFVEWLLNRVNTVNGLRYREDPTILCWELGNEIDKASTDWIAATAGLIKSLDRKHLLMDGSHKEIWDENLADRNIDIVTTHYTDNEVSDWALRARKAGKAYVYGEFAPTDPAQVERICTAVRDSGASGALAWSLRFRSRLGGFYWHTDFNGSSDSLQYPGFDNTKPQKEGEIFTILRRHAWEIRGLKAPAEPVPDAPVLLPPQEKAGSSKGIKTGPRGLSWQGSAGARYYRLEQADTQSGPWKVLANKLLDTASTRSKGVLVANLPLFTLPEGGKPAWYRLIAVNDAGDSEASAAEFF